MSLLTIQKAERRDRILSEAQRLIARRGWAGTTMRELARESRVSVPTVYNLIGGKDALLGALMEDLFVKVTEAAVVTDGDVVTRARSLWRGGLVPFIEAPEYSKELMRLFVSSTGVSEIRREQDERYVELMAAVLAAGQRKGELSRLVSPNELSWSMYSLWIAYTIRWAHRDIDDDELCISLDRGLSLLLLGVAEGEARTALTRVLEETQPQTVIEPGTRGVA